MVKQTRTEKYLQEQRAWNWLWPDERGRWDTKRELRGVTKNAHKTLFTSVGPSKKTLGKRAAKARRGH